MMMKSLPIVGRFCTGQWRRDQVHLSPNIIIMVINNMTKKFTITITCPTLFAMNETMVSYMYFLSIGSQFSIIRDCMTPRHWLWTVYGL